MGWGVQVFRGNLVIVYKFFVGQSQKTNRINTPVIPLFQTSTAEISCYYCGYNIQRYQDILNHRIGQHETQHIKIKKYSLYAVSGEIEYHTKTYPIIPCQLSNDDLLQLCIQ